MKTQLSTTQQQLPYTIIDNFRVFDWHLTCSYLQDKGKELHGPKFHLRREDWPVLRKLLIYHVGDQELCAAAGIDLEKGILLTGPIGCGKTTLMQLFQILSYKHQRYRVIPTRKIAYEFQAEGFQIIHKYAQTIAPICLDDLGLEQTIKHFGNDCNTIAEILLQRYELYRSEDILTHATTNLTSSELEKLYGNRVRSRLREMFNLISFPESCNDKRK